MGAKRGTERRDIVIAGLDPAVDGLAFKERVAARPPPPESSPVGELSTKIGISVATLERWRAECPARASGEQRRRWTPAETRRR